MSYVCTLFFTILFRTKLTSNIEYLTYVSHCDNCSVKIKPNYCNYMTWAWAIHSFRWLFFPLRLKQIYWSHTTHMIYDSFWWVWFLILNRHRYSAHWSKAVGTQNQFLNARKWFSMIGQKKFTDSHTHTTNAHNFWAKNCQWRIKNAHIVCIYYNSMKKKNIIFLLFHWAKQEMKKKKFILLKS